jgi:hypothetical protein
MDIRRRWRGGLGRRRRSRRMPSRCPVGSRIRLLVVFVIGVAPAAFLARWILQGINGRHQSSVCFHLLPFGLADLLQLV